MLASRGIAEDIKNKCHVISKEDANQWSHTRKKYLKITRSQCTSPLLSPVSALVFEVSWRNGVAQFLALWENQYVLALLPIPPISIGQRGFGWRSHYILTLSKSASSWWPCPAIRLSSYRSTRAGNRSLSKSGLRSRLLPARRLPGPLILTLATLWCWKWTTLCAMHLPLRAALNHSPAYQFWSDITMCSCFLPPCHLLFPPIRQ